MYMTFQPYSVTVLLTVQIKGKLRYLMAYRWRSITALKILMKKLNLLLGDLKTPTCRLLRCYLWHPCCCWLEMNPLHLFSICSFGPSRCLCTYRSGGAALTTVFHTTVDLGLQPTFTSVSFDPVLIFAEPVLVLKIGSCMTGPQKTSLSSILAL